MKFPFLFKHTESSATSAWPWPTCVNSPKTLSFRGKDNTTMFKTTNSTYVQDLLLADDDQLGSSSNTFFSSLHGNKHKVDDDDDDIVTGLLRSSDRLFFEPGESNFITEEVKGVQNDDGLELPCNKESHVTVMALDSRDPFLDFRVSMEEMVRAHGLKRWECLENLLTSYLKLNEKSNHGYIIEAFVDLMVNINLYDDYNDCTNDDEKQRDNSCSCSDAAVINQCLHEGSFTSPLSFCSSSFSFSSPSMEVTSEGLLVVNRANIDEKSSNNSIVSCSSSLSCNNASFTSSV